MEFFTTATLFTRLQEAAQNRSNVQIVLRADRFRDGDDFNPLASGLASAEVGQNVYVSMGAMGQDTYTLTEHTADGERLWQFAPQEYEEDFMDWFSAVAN